MVYVTTAEKIIMFGGATDEQHPLNETWMYDRDKNAWTDLKPSGNLPSARRNTAAAYDPGTNKIVIFGGLGADGDVLDDTWEYDVTENTWTPWIARTPSPQPSARYGAEMVYDPESGRLLLFGGTYSRRSATASFQQDFNDTWAFSLPTATWINLDPAGTPPNARAEGAVSMTYNEASGTMLLLAGVPPTPRVVTTGDQYKDWSGWNYETSTNSWSENPRASGSPSISQHYALDFDRRSRMIVLFGGADVDGETQDDTWLYDPVASTWSMVLAGAADGPPGRVDHAMVYDAATGTMIMFGGRSAGGKNADVPNDTWEYTSGITSTSSLAVTSPPSGEAKLDHTLRGSDFHQYFGARNSEFRCQLHRAHAGQRHPLVQLLLRVLRRWLRSRQDVPGARGRDDSHPG